MTIDKKTLAEARARVAADDGAVTDDDRRLVKLHGADEDDTEPARQPDEVKPTKKAARPTVSS